MEWWWIRIRCIVSLGWLTTEARDWRPLRRCRDSCTGSATIRLCAIFYGPHLTEEEVFAHGAAKKQLYREMMRPGLAQALVPGIREYLERHQDAPIGLATNAEPNNALFTLEEAGLHPFHAVVNDTK